MIDYTEIIKDDFFIESYKKIEFLKKDFYVNHGFLHINHVVENAKNIAKLFNLSKEDTNLLLCAATLHDIGYLKEYRHSHAINGATIANEYLIKKDVDEVSREKICKAIAHHGGKAEYDFDSAISTCLILADKIDFVASRYSQDASKYPKVIPYLNILKTELNLENNALILTITTTKEFEKYKQDCTHVLQAVQDCLNTFSNATGMDNKIIFSTYSD